MMIAYLLWIGCGSPIDVFVSALNQSCEERRTAVWHVILFELKVRDQSAKRHHDENAVTVTSTPHHKENVGLEGQLH